MEGGTGQKEEKKEKEKEEEMEKEEEKKKEYGCGQDGRGRTDGTEGSIRGPRGPKNAGSCVKLAPLRASANLTSLSIFC